MALRHLTLLLLFFFFFASGEPSNDRKALLTFLSNTPHSPRIQWNNSTSTCSWAGVSCNSNRSAVIALRLPASGLIGPIPPATLGRLSSLRILSLRSNHLTAPIPTDLSNLTHLHSLYLQNNRISGTFPPAIPLLSNLAHLDLSGNNFHGEVPSVVNNLTRLIGLFLQQNQFSGSLPIISIPGLVDFNVSYNTFNGSIPAALEKFPASSFAGNLHLCGPPLAPCAAPFPAPSPIPQPNSGKSSKKISNNVIIAIAAAVGSAALVALLLLLFCCCARRRKGRKGRKQSAERSGDTGMTSSSKEVSRVGPAGEKGRNQVMFVKGGGGGYRFDLEDLLRASAEVLGKGSVGTSYKAVLEEGNAVVVKRLKDVAASKRDFERNVESVGKVEHMNLLPVRGYYYSKDEKLVVLDYVAGGSLSSNLHGGRGYGQTTPLEWDSRMRIALAVGRGLAHLHGPAGLVHGNVKASNVLLWPDPDTAALSDYGLGPFFGPGLGPANQATVGYRAPEVLQTRRVTFKSDVYSFGVLLLELLTGKAPSQATAAGDEGADLPLWVQSVVREEWTAEVFDVQLARRADAEEEMVKVLQIAMACVALAPDNRPDMFAVVRLMEDVSGIRGGAPEADEGSKPPPVGGAS